jgi:hypothetical protein
MTDINSIDLKTTTLRIIGHAENSNGGAPVLWELSLRGQMLGLYANHESVCNAMLLAVSNDEHLYDMVNERCDILRRKDDFTADLVDRQIVSLHKARISELNLRNKGLPEQLVQFEKFGFHWETNVTEGQYCDGLFFCATDIYGKWVNAAELFEVSDKLFEAVYDAAVEAL